MADTHSHGFDLFSELINPFSIMGPLRHGTCRTGAIRDSQNKTTVRLRSVCNIVEEWEGKPGALARSFAFLYAMLHIRVLKRCNLHGLPTTYKVQLGLHFCKKLEDLSEPLQRFLTSQRKIRQLDDLIKKLRPTSAMGVVLFIEAAMDAWELRAQAPGLVNSARELLNS
jgi:hypothetical protein